MRIASVNVEGAHKKAKMRRDLRHENDAPKNKNKESEKGIFFLKYPGIWRPYHNRRTIVMASTASITSL